MTTKKQNEKTPASLREFVLLTTNHKGVPFNSAELKAIREEDEFVKNMQLGDEMPEEMVFRNRKRGQAYDHLKMAISIMELPKGDRGVTRKDGRVIESLLDKLYDAEEAEVRPKSVLLDEGEWKHLRDRVEEHPFPNHGRATRAFQSNVIDNTEKVPVKKANSGE